MLFEGRGTVDGDGDARWRSRFAAGDDGEVRRTPTRRVGRHRHEHLVGGGRHGFVGDARWAAASGGAAQTSVGGRDRRDQPGRQRRGNGRWRWGRVCSHGGRSRGVRGGSGVGRTDNTRTFRTYAPNGTGPPRSVSLRTKPCGKEGSASGRRRPSTGAGSAAARRRSREPIPRTVAVSVAFDARSAARELLRRRQSRRLARRVRSDRPRWSCSFTPESTRRATARSSAR